MNFQRALSLESEIEVIKDEENEVLKQVGDFFVKLRKATQARAQRLDPEHRAEIEAEGKKIEAKVGGALREIIFTDSLMLDAIGRGSENGARTNLEAQKDAVKSLRAFMESVRDNDYRMPPPK